LISSGIVSLRAQPTAVQQLQNNQITQQLQTPMVNLAAGTNAPELFPGESADVGPQRILRLNPRQTYFDVLLDSQVFYSDNANYAQAPLAVGSAVFVNTVQAAFAPAAVDLWRGKGAAAIGLASQWYNYGNNQLENLDFNAETFFVSGKYTLDKWQVGVGANLTRLVNQENYAETYREFMPNFGVQRVLPIHDRLFFSIGDLVDYHLTQVPSVLGSRTDINDRFDNIASVTLTWQATSRLILQPYYRFQYSYYQHNAIATSDRNDYLQGVGFAAAYYFNQKISVRAFYGYNRRQTDDQFTPAYHEMNGGVGVTLDIKF
jgi:predicted porin